MKKYMLNAIPLIAVLLFVSCSREQKQPVMKVYQGGNEYSVLDRGDTHDEGKPAYFVRYLSADPADDVILKTECADLYAIIAKHLDTNEHQRVVIEAVEQNGRLFGLMKPREVRVSKSAQDVLAYKPKEAEAAE
jgi:hypothetical protein